MKYFLVKTIRDKIIKSYVFFVKYFTRINKRRIVLHQPFKFGYDCNQKYIAEEILKQNLPYEIIWITRATRADNENYPSEIKVITEKQLFKTLYYFLTSKVCISNSFLPFKHYISKKRGQIYINTWHGSLGIKKIGLTEKYLGSNNEKVLKRTINLTDFFISNSDFETNVYRNSLCYNNEILTFGHPRNDILINGILSEEDKIKINKKVRQYNNYNISENTKLVLYAPTFRPKSNLNCLDMDYQLLLETLKSRFGEDFVLLLRLHPTMKDIFKSFNLKSENIFDYTKFDDMQELMIASDILITDYSSCIYDFMLTEKIGFIYASDIDEYDTERGFYYPLESTPFPVIKNNSELKEKIINFDSSKYVIEVQNFLKDKGCIEDGNASRRVVDLIKKYI